MNATELIELRKLAEAVLDEDKPNQRNAGIIIELLDTIEAQANELADALDCKNGKGPTALGMVIAERDALRAQLEAQAKQIESLSALAAKNFETATNALEQIEALQTELKNASVAAIAEALEVDALQAKLSEIAAQELTLENAPLGTKAPAYTGGHWVRVERGWKWNTGATFPRPGGDWDGRLTPLEVQPARGRAVYDPVLYIAQTPDAFYGLQSNAEQVHITDHPDVRCLRKWLSEEQLAPIDKVALANVLVMLTHPAKQATPTDAQAQHCGKLGLTDALAQAARIAASKLK